EPGVFEGDVLDQGIEGDHRGHPLLVRPPKMNTMTLGRILFVLEIESWGQPGVPQASTAREGPTVRLVTWYPMTSLPPRRGAYGFDAPYAPLLMALGGACLLALTALNLSRAEINSAPPAVRIFPPGVAGLWLVLHPGFFVFAPRAGKFAVWAELLDWLDLQGDERLLDVGCGRGAVLLMAAQRLPRGRAVGIDVWSAKDQSGNAEQVTRRNADLEGVADRVELHTADMRQLPFEDGSFDVVVSSLAIHNISGAGE